MEIFLENCRFKEYNLSVILLKNGEEHEKTRTAYF